MTTLNETKKRFMKLAGLLNESSSVFKPTLSITYEIISPESAEQGDVEERGFEEENISLEPDEIDLDEADGDRDLAIVKNTVKLIKDHGGFVEPSSSQFHPGVWYTSYGEQDFNTGNYENHSYHLNGFTPEQEEKVYLELTKKRQSFTVEQFTKIVSTMINEEYKKQLKSKNSK